MPRRGLKTLLLGVLLVQVLLLREVRVLKTGERLLALPGRALIAMTATGTAAAAPGTAKRPFVRQFLQLGLRRRAGIWGQ